MSRADQPTLDELAAALGHTVINDGPTFGSAERRTCTKCGRAILRFAGNVYGSAAEEDCPGKRTEAWER